MYKVTSSLDRTDSLRCYLKEIGRIPLLTHAQEVEYGKQIQRRMSLLTAKEALKKKLRREPTQGEWVAQVKVTDYEMLSRILHSGQRAIQQLVAANLRLVVAIAKRFCSRGIELLDLIQEGSIGLQKAAEKFDPSKGYRFSTYAYYLCKQRIFRAVAEDSRIIRLPAHVSEKMNRVKKASREFTQQYGRKPSIAELTEKLDLTSEQVQQVLEAHFLQPISLSGLLRSEEQKTLEEIIEDTKGETAQTDELLYSCMRDDLEQLMANLKQREQEVLKLRFGWSDWQDLTLAEIGDRLQLSRERIRQVENKALEKLRQHKKVLSGY